jgi:hypothetical protein
MSLGGQTITFLSYTPTGVSDSLGQQTLTETAVAAAGCRHRPLTFREMVELEFDIATEVWKSTIPINELMAQNPDAYNAVMTVKPQDAISVDGIVYQVLGGVRPHPDMDGNPYKATLISTKQIG